VGNQRATVPRSRSRLTNYRVSPPTSFQILGWLPQAPLHCADRRLLRVEGDNQKAKQPYAIAMKDGAPFGIAGIWENWKEPASGEWIRTFAIITTDARRARIRESIDRAAPVLNSRQRLQTSAWRRDSAISVADQLRLPYRALRSAPAPCAEIRLRSVQSSHPYGG
jgi:hypothetical protein